MANCSDCNIEIRGDSENIKNTKLEMETYFEYGEQSNVPQYLSPMKKASDWLG